MPPPNRIDLSTGMCLTNGDYVDGEGRVVGSAETGFTDPAYASAFRSGAGPQEALDFMTGGNRRHNQEIDQVVTRRALEMLDEMGVSVDSAAVRRFVHDQLRHYKVNNGRQRNGNVSRQDFQEILDHTVAHFGGIYSLDSGERLVATSEDMNWRIERMIEEELAKPENARLAEDVTFRDRLRTQLRAEFASVLMNQWGVERLEEMGEFFRDSVVRDFQVDAAGILATEASAAREAGPSVIENVSTRPLATTVIENVPGPVPASAAEQSEQLRRMEAEIRRVRPDLASSNFDNSVRVMAEDFLSLAERRGQPVAFDAAGRTMFAVGDYITRYEAYVTETRSDPARRQTFRFEDYEERRLERERAERPMERVIIPRR